MQLCLLGEPFETDPVLLGNFFLTLLLVQCSCSVLAFHMRVVKQDSCSEELLI